MECEEAMWWVKGGGMWRGEEGGMWRVKREGNMAGKG